MRSLRADQAISPELVVRLAESPPGGVARVGAAQPHRRALAHVRGPRFYLADVQAEPPFAAPARSMVEFTNADIGSSPAPYTVNRPLMPSVGNAAVSVPSYASG
jgi:hypothetical protein